MALVSCPDCGKEISNAAPSCPNCGRPMAAAAAPPAPAAKPKPATSGCAVGCLVLLLGWLGMTLFGMMLGGGASTSTTTPPPRSAPAKPAPPAKPPLEIQAWSWHEEYSYAIVEGQVKNTSGDRIEHLQAIVSFSTKDGTFISSDSGMVEFDPLLPGQVSPFKVIAKYNPAMNQANLTFKTMFGGQLAATTKGKK